MWGDAEGAYSLKQSDSLSKSLLQITGPDHIPYNDSRWQQLLLHYEQLVHLQNLGLVSPASSADQDDVVGSACRQCAEYSAGSSNLAALCLHVARMIRDLQLSLQTYYTGPNGDTAANGNCVSSPDKSSVKQRISLIGKARVTCGAINLLRILSHETIVQSCSSEPGAAAGGEGSTFYQGNGHESEYDSNHVLKEIFTYKSKDGANGESGSQDAGVEIIAAIMAFLSSIGNATQKGVNDGILSIPEMYDIIVQIFSLLLVLLSTQLYQPMTLDLDGRPSRHFFLEKWIEYSIWQRTSSRQRRGSEELLWQQQAQSLGHEIVSEPESIDNEPLLLLYVCLSWLIDRPSPPRRSISLHRVDLPKTIAQQMTNMAIAPDGMYESHSIVMATAPRGGDKVVPKMANPSVKTPMQTSPKTQAPLDSNNGTHQTASIALGTDDEVNVSSPGQISNDGASWNTPSNMLLHPLRSILLLSSSFILLPIRLVRLAFNLLGHSQHRAIIGGSGSYNMKDLTDGDQAILQQLQAQCEKQTGWNRTNNILWLSDSPIADLASAVMLILTNNYRSHERDGKSSSQNPFRSELDSLNDNRWTNATAENQSIADSSLFPPSPRIDEQITVLSVNFESLFDAFGRIVHTEVGALTLYTLLLSSPVFADSIAARSDLDTLVMPILRSLYFSTTIAHPHGGKKSMPKSGQSLITLTPSNRPFRSQSQLYVILILLLIFSQDPNFGRDSFRRVRVSTTAMKWYKERRMKEASLGSMILLVLLRAITFNLNRLQDGFLLSNCYAVLLNLSPHITDLPEYVSIRLVSVTTSCFKRYSTLVAENGEEPEIDMEGDLSTLLGMYGETCRTLLTLIKHSIRRKCLEKNIHLVYQVLIEQQDFEHMSQYVSLGDISSISALIEKANNIIQEHGYGGVMSADQTMGVLKTHLAELKSYCAPEGFVSDGDSVASDASDLGNLTFTYEEEADPEVFFVPYVWDVIVGSLTTTTMEWRRAFIQVFPLNDENEDLLAHHNTEVLDGDAGALDNTPDVV